MKHLYIIGNGFDIFTGLKTKFSDFEKWLRHVYPFVYEALFKVYAMDGDWWKDFELQLGKLDIPRYIREYVPIQKSVQDIQMKRMISLGSENKYHLPPSLDYSSPCARHLSGLLVILHNCLREWVECCQEVIESPQFMNIVKNDSFFINFNYTDVLERIYGIPDKYIIHIHGRASQSGPLVFGHDSILLDDGTTDCEQVCFELGMYRKFPYEHIGKYGDLPEIIKDIEFLHIYGLSFSSVDIDYIDWIYKHTSRNAEWDVSWFTDEDRTAICEFVEGHWGLEGRLEYVRLEEKKLK